MSMRAATPVGDAGRTFVGHARLFELEERVALCTGAGVHVQAVPGDQPCAPLMSLSPRTILIARRQ
jgi:hypothetical protein